MTLRNNWTDGEAFFHSDQNDVANEVNAKVDKATLTAKGDIYVATNSGTVTNLGVGTNGLVLTADSSEPSGIKWADPTEIFTDGTLTLQDNVDPTKQVKFEVSGITTGTTRTLSMPDASTTLVGTDVAQTLTNKTLYEPTITSAGAQVLTLNRSGDAFLSVENGSSKVIFGATGGDAFVGTQTGTTLNFRTGNVTRASLTTAGDFNTVGAITANNVPVVTTTGSQTLSNKTLASPTLSGTTTVSSGGFMAVPGLNTFYLSTTTNVTHLAGSDAGSYIGTNSVSKYAWHDLLRYHAWWGTPTYETYNGTVWASATAVNGVFSGKEAGGYHLVNGVAATGVRWIWNSTNAPYSYPRWWVIGLTYVGATSPINTYLIESSADGVAWTTRHTSTVNAQAAPLWLSMSDNAGDRYIRLTITNTNAQPIGISAIKALSSRWGNQGGGSELEVPYDWDFSRNITTYGNLTVGTPGTSAGSAVTINATQTLTNKTLTSPTLTSPTTSSPRISDNVIKDSNGNTVLSFAATASAVNYINLWNRAAAGAAPVVEAVGSDTNVSLNLRGKGTGVVQINGAEAVTVSGTQTLTNKTLTSPAINSIQDSTTGGLVTVFSGSASPTGYHRLYNTATPTSGTILLAAEGSATNLNHRFVTKGSGVFQFYIPTGQTVANISGVSAGGTTTLNLTSQGTGTVQANGVDVELTSRKGVANGYASLDTNGKVPGSQLPNSIMTYQGLHNASTNSPALTDAGGAAGQVYRISVAGTRNYGAGNIELAVGDYLIHNGTAWEKADTTDAVSTVNGYTGNVSLTKSDVGLGNVDNTSDATKNSATATLTNKTLTAPVINDPKMPLLRDENNLPYLNLSTTYSRLYVSPFNRSCLEILAPASAVNRFSFNSAVTGGTPTFGAMGNDTNVSLNLTSQGTGTVKANGVDVATVSGSQTLTNKTISGSSNTITSLPASATPNAARLVRTTGSTVIGQWARVLTFAAPAAPYFRYHAMFSISCFARGGAIIDVDMGTLAADQVNGSVQILSRAGNSLVGDDSFKIINNGYGQPFELWFKSAGGGSIAFFYEIGKISEQNVTFETTSTFTATEPVGTVLNVVSAGGVLADGVPVVTTTGSQTLTNKTLTSPSISGSVTMGSSTGASVPTTTPLSIDMGSTYGTNAVGDKGNLKVVLYNDLAASKFGFGVSANRLEYQAPGAAHTHSFYTGGVERLAITNTATTVSNNLTVDNGTSTLIDVVSDDGGTSGIRLYGAAQGTGYVEVAQAGGTYGGGMYYNGDGSPAFATGETADTIGFYRLNAGARSEVFYYSYLNDDVVFNGNIAVGTSASTSTATPASINLGGTYGSSTPGNSANLKVRVFDDGTYKSGIGFSASAMEYQIPANNAHRFYVAGVETLAITGTTLRWAGVDIPTISSTSTLTNKTLTTPRIAQINDANGNPTVQVGGEASAVNYIYLRNSATGNQVQVRSAGPDANISLGLNSKGTGRIFLMDSGSFSIAQFVPVTTPANYWTFTNATAGNAPTVDVTGSDTNVSMNLTTKGTGTVKANGVDVVTTTGSQTLTNKTVVSPTITGAVTSTAVVQSIASGTSNYAARPLGPRSGYGVNASFVPGVHNYLTNLIERGGTVTATKNGSPLVLPDPGKLFRGLENINNYTVLTGAVDDVYVIEADLGASMAVGSLTAWGGTSGVIYDNGPAKNTKIEWFFNGAWTTIYESLNNPTIMHWGGSGAQGPNAVTKIRWTLTANAVSTFIVELFHNSLYAGNVTKWLPATGGSVYGSAASPPTLQAAGADANIDLDLRSKGSGVVEANGIPVVTTTASQTLTNKTLTSPTVNNPSINTPVLQGGDNDALVYLNSTATNASYRFYTKGTGGLSVLTSDSRGIAQFSSVAAGTAVNYTQIVNAATGVAPYIAAIGSDTNINLDLNPKGSGQVRVTGVPIVTETKTQTLTNKTLTAPAVSSPTLSGTASGMLAIYTGMTSQDDHLNSPISLRERGAVAAAQSGNEYSPNLNFHWASRVSNSLWMNSSGALNWGGYDAAGVPNANGTINAASFVGTLTGNATTATTAAYTTNGIAPNTNSYINARVIQNSNTTTSNDGLYIGYGNTNGGQTRLFGGGDTTNPITIGTGGTITATGSVTTSGLTVDGGTSSLVTIRSDDTGTSGLLLRGESQGTSFVEVTQDGFYGGGMSFFGGGGSTFATGEGTDSVTFYRRGAGTRTAVFGYSWASSDVNFAGAIAATGAITSGGVAVPTISSSSTLTNKTISGASNTITNIPASATPDAARLVCATAPGASGAENGANTWVKVATFATGTDQYKDLNLMLGVTCSNAGVTESAIVSAYFQSGATGAVPLVNVHIMSHVGNGVLIKTDSFKVIANGWAGSMELWFRKGGVNGTFSFFELSRSQNGGTLTYTASPAAWQSATPVGTSHNVSSIGAVVAGIPVVTTTGAQTLTNKTLTDPSVNALKDTGGWTSIYLPAAGTAVNYLTVANATTGNAVQVKSNGADSNVSLNLIPQGSGTVQANGIPVVTTTASQTLTNKTISGASNTLSNISISSLSDAARLFNNMGDNHEARATFDAQGANLTVGFGWRFVQGSTNGPGTNSAAQYYSLVAGLGNNYAASSYAMQIAIPRNVGNPYISIRYAEAGLTAWQKISAGYADTAGSATTATSAATLTTARNIGGVSFNGSADITLPGVNAAGNQNTTGSAATLTTARTIALSGAVTGTATSFNGSANITIPTTVSATQGGVIYGSSATAYASTAAGTAGYFLASNGTGAPTWVVNDLSSMPGAGFKKCCQAATTANITLSAPQTIDGVAVVAGNRVLVKNQTTAAQNGIYQVNAGAWTRVPGGDSTADIASAVVTVENGTVNGGQIFTNVFKITDTLGTTAMPWYRVYTDLDATTSNAANKLVLRDANGYAFAAYFNNNHAATTRNSDTIFYTSTDDYIRKNTVAGAKTSLGLNNVDNTSDATKNAATATLTNKTLTSPRANQILDTGGATILGFSASASATAYVQVWNSTGSPTVGAVGAAANIGLYLQPKGTGSVLVYSESGDAKLVSDGAGANVNLNLQSKGTGTVQANGSPVVTPATTHAATLKSALVAADEFLLVDSEASWALKKTTWQAILDILGPLFATVSMTFTNKRITSRIGTEASNATPTINCDLYDQYNITALAANITSVTVTGTPTDGQKLMVRIKGTASRTIAWGASFVASGVAPLLTTTVTTKTHLCSFLYDSAAAKWVAVAIDDQGY